MLVKAYLLCVSCSAWHSALRIVGAHQMGLNRYLEGTRMVILAGQFLLNLRNLQQIPLADQPRQLPNHSHMLRYGPRHLLELWIILDKGLPWEKQQLGFCHFLTEDRHIRRREKKIARIILLPRLRHLWVLITGILLCLKREEPVYVSRLNF